MRLLSLTLKGFRSYADATIVFDPNAEQFLFYGDNGAGKTNIVEAISYLSSGRSCLQISPDAAVHFGETFFRITGEVLSDAGEKKVLEHVFQMQPRRASAFFIDDLRTPLLSFIGSMPTILFLPEYLDLFTATPQGRRRFIDALLVQLFPTFAAVRLEYDKVLKQRNALLRAIAAGEARRDDLAVWNGALADAALPILAKRRAILTALGATLPLWLRHFGERWTDAELRYSTKTDDDRDSFLKALEHDTEKDVAREATSTGPHRDDWEAHVDGHLLAECASRGQQRTALLSLLAASADLFTKHRQEKPIVILDDVFSELDAAHQQALVRTLKGTQVLMTSTHALPKNEWLVQRRVADAVVEA